MFVYLLLSQPTLAHKEDTKLFYTYPFILYSDNGLQLAAVKAEQVLVIHIFIHSNNTNYY